MRSVVAVLAAAAAVIAAPPASAAVRYAVPAGGTTEPCTAIEPCTLQHAAGADAVVDGDEIVVLPGTYELAATLMIGKKLDIHGQTGGPRPKLTGTFATGALVHATAGAGTEIVDLDLEQSGSDRTTLMSDGATTPDGDGVLVDRVRAVADGERSQAMRIGAGDTVRNSVAWVKAGSESIGIVGESPTGTAGIEVRNVTAVAPTNCIRLNGSGADTMLVRNTIARDCLIGIRAATSEPASSAVIDLDYSSYTSLGMIGNGKFEPDPSLAHNQDFGPGPAFIDPANGDFRQLPGSRTIDAGLDSPGDNGPQDLEGDERLMGVHTDIGADEFTPPPPVTPVTTVSGASGAPADVLAPAVTRFRATNVRFRRGAAPRGTVFRYSLSETARAVIVLERVATGRRVGGRCRPVTRRNRARRPCTRFVRAGSLTQAGRTGANALRFSGRIGRRGLPLGVYRASIVATDAAGNASKRRRLRLRIVRR